ncbi:MAG: alpha/beta hydrolase [Anaerolineae bacterium]|nr:alpha/beta hydrolase [Anaerolineae bacterium]
MELFHPFRSELAKKEYLTFYDQRALGWNVPSETKMVDTSFGQTFVRISGLNNTSPLVLLPASVFNSLMWIPNIADLSQKYRTYAIDNIYDCGRSIYTQTLSSPEDLVGWLDELFTALELDDRINLMGLSYGSWLAHQYALRFPKRLRKLVLLAHPTIVPMNPTFILRLMLSFVSPRFFRNFVYWLFLDTARYEHSKSVVESVYEDMRLAGKCFKPKAIINPTAIKDSEISNFQLPTLFLVGENEKTFSPQKAIQRLNKIAPQIKTKMIPQAGHDLNFAQANLVNREVLEFLE